MTEAQDIGLGQLRPTPMSCEPQRRKAPVFIAYPAPIAVHTDSHILTTCVAAYDSRKHKDKVLVFQTGESRYIHVVAGTKTCVGSTTRIKRPSYNSFERKS